MSEKNYKIEALRFIAAFLIMVEHVNGILHTSYNVFFLSFWMYVEFFLFLSGFLLSAHFDSKRNLTIDAFKYNIIKFIKYLPFSFFPVLIMNIGCAMQVFLRTHNVFLAIDNFKTFIIEVCFLGVFLPFEVYKLFPMWYMSALFISGFLFIFMLVDLNRKYSLIFFIIVGTIFYLFVPNYGEHTTYMHLLRTFAGLCIGCVCYNLYLCVRSCKNKHFRYWITILEFISFICPLFIFPLFNWTPKIFILLLYITFIVCAFTNLSYIPNVKCDLTVLMSKLALPIYLWHWPIGAVYSHIHIHNVILYKFLCYSTIIVVSYINCYIVDKFDLKSKILSFKIIKHII